ncbi:MAG TPA: hypothetical protein VL992_18660, partial [Tepidisphaeraceae bacterium]|nr:hypothetical protein [Tepidisphaeraceae bacterium]
MLDRVQSPPTPGSQADPADVTHAAVADPVWLRGIVWLLILAYLGLTVYWAYGVGMKMRDDIWVYSRTIRFHGDVANAMRWGNLVLRTAERVANLPGHPGPTAVANPKPGDANQRALTFWEILRGEDQVYQDLVVGEPPDGDYRLDYPPLRLLSMTLWTRQVQSHYPGVENWPGRWELRYSATGDPRSLVNEDIAQPLLRANTYTIAGSAIISFLLVWIWVNRGGRPALPIPRRGISAWLLPKRKLAAWKLTPLRQTRGLIGLILFPIGATAFFYAATIAESPAPAPAPSIEFVDRPILTAAGNGNVSATINANIDGQGNDAQWHAEWGLTPLYGHQTADQAASNDPVAATLNDLPPHTIIHYRLTARNDDDRDSYGRGVTHTDDETFNTSDVIAPMPSRQVYGQVWLTWPQWVELAILFVVMAAGLRMLPHEHRGWAAGLVAALMLWFDPGVLVDSHVWPQWDVWTLPPFLLAALLGTLDWWFVAGLVLGVGVMFKGQTLVTAPVLLLWPLLSMRWGAVARMVVGFVLAAGLVLSPWLVMANRPPMWEAGALRWIECAVVAALIGVAISFFRAPVRRRAAVVWTEFREQYWRRGKPQTMSPIPVYDSLDTSIFDLVIFCISLLVGIIVCAELVLGRWPTDLLITWSYGLTRNAGLLLLLAILVVPWFLPRRGLGVWLAAILGAAIWISPYLYNGDWSWKTVGFDYGTRKFTRMALGAGGNGNLPLILQERFGWDVHDPALTYHLPDLADLLHLGTRSTDGTFDGWVHTIGLDGSPVTLDIRQFLMGVFGIVMFLGGVGAAMQSRRNDPRFLAALAGVWALMPNILCQMAGRYQIWGGAVSCLVIAVGPELTLLHIVISLLAAGMVASQLLAFDTSRSPQLHDLLTRFQPDDGWIMLAIGAVFLFVALTPAWRPPREELEMAVGTKARRHE